LWWTWQRAEQARQRQEQEGAVNRDLEEVAVHLQAWKVAEARTALVRAEGRVAGGGPDALLGEVRRTREHLSVADELDRIRLRKATIVDGKFDYASADRDYATLFQKRGLVEEGEEPGLVADRMRGSPIQAQLVAALDDWAVTTDNRGRRRWLLGVARRAQPGAWSDRFRDPAAWSRRATLERLAREAKVAELSPQLLTALGEALRSGGRDAVPLLKAGQERHPADFWLNFLLGNALLQAKPEEAAGYYRAALALRPDTPAAYNNLGNALQTKGQLDEAVAAYRQAITLNPKDAKAHNNLGNALADKGQRDEAIAAYRQAIELDPKLISAHNNLGTALGAKGQLDEAIKLHRQAITLEPQDAGAHYNFGIALKAKGQLDEAIAAYRQAIALDPKHAKAHDNLGIVLAAKGQRDEAIKLHRQAIALDPKHANAHTNLGTTLADKGQVDEAIQAYRKAIALDPKHAKAHYNLGTVLYAKGQLDEAIKLYRKAIDLDPEHVEAHYNLGIALYAKGQRDEAIQAYRRAIKLNPNYSIAHYNLGLALVAKGQVDEAIAAFRQSIELDPKHAPAYNNLGTALATKGQLDEAVAAYRQAITLNPKDAKAHNNLGNALADKGQVDEAIQAYRKAIEFGLKDAHAHAHAHDNLGSALFRKGQLDDAIAAYRKAIDLNPKLAHAHGALGQALLKQGRFAEARAATRRCLDLLPPNDPLRKLGMQQLRQCERWRALDEKLPALLKGEVKPADVAERLDLAQLCQGYKQLYAAAARFYAEAFAEQPKLAADPRSQHRYAAACAAALAAADRGKDADKLGGKERARLRQQALDWLGADLVAWTKVVDKGPPQERTLVQRTLRHWQKNPDLAALRDPGALAQLPEAERAACRKLWSDVEALLARARE
jgi:superkiller protein 3